MSNTVDFILPDLGEGVHEAEIISWKVKPGDVVEEMQVLAEMETDKALVEVPSPYSGTIVTLHGEEGTIAHVGRPIVTFENASQGGKPIAGGQSAANTAGKADGAVETGKAAALQAEPAGKAGANGRAAKSEDAEEERKDAGTVVGSVDSTLSLGRAGKVMATPAVRRLAKELGIDINTVRGTGRGGRVTASDVQNAASGGAARVATAPARETIEATPAHAAGRPAEAPAPVQVDASGTAERIPFKGVRRKIAEALDRSVKTAVHFTVMDTADVTQLNLLRKRQAAATGEKLSFLPFVVQAACRALKQFPALNANVDDENAEILIKGVQNIGIAVDTEHGLMVPVIANADRIGVVPLQRRINEVAEKCRSRTIARDELRGGTFTVSNVGSHGGAFATPIINYPEVAILGVGRARERVMARHGGIFIGLEMPLSLSCDHRVVDGADGARMLNHIVQLLENPEILLEPAGR